MGNDILEIRSQVAGMLAADRAMLAPLAQQVKKNERNPDVRWLLDAVEKTLRAHADELAGHLERLGGGPGAQPDAEQTLGPTLMASAAPALSARGAARLLRNSYTALSVAHAEALMLETNARAHGYSSTAAMARRHREELLTLLGQIRDSLPAAIKEEIAQIEIAT